MRGHLTDHEMAAHAAGSLEGDGLVHLLSCAACREERARLRAGLVGLAARIHAETEQPEAFFQDQHRKIARRLWERRPRSQRWRRGRGPALAASALLAVLLTPGGPPVQRREDSEADQALLRAVQQSIQAEVPEALRPAALLLGELERGVSRPDRKDIVPKGDPP
jgi:hypothetical protein